MPTALAAAVSIAGSGAHRGAELALFAKPGRLCAREHRDAAGLRAVQVSVCAPAAEQGEIRWHFWPRFFSPRSPRIAVPILIHLTQRERKQVVEFPSLMFLREDSVSVGPPAPHPRLAAAGDAAGGDSPDCAGVRAAVLRTADDCARQRVGPARSGDSARSVVQHGLRRSLGAGANGRAPGRPGLAAERSRDARFSSARSAQLEVRASADLSRVIAAIDAAKLSAEATRYAPGLKLAQRVLTDSTLPDPRSRHDQRLPAPWLGARRKSSPAGRGDVHAGADHRRADRRTSRSSSVLPQRSMFSGQERVTVGTQIINRGPAAANNVQVRLELDGRQVESQDDHRAARRPRRR